MKLVRTLSFAAALLCATVNFAHAHTNSTSAADLADDGEMLWAAVKTPTKVERTALVNLGFSIEQVIDDTSYGLATKTILAKLPSVKLEKLWQMPAKNIRALDFPAGDAIYHNYAEQQAFLDDLVKRYPGILTKFSVGRTLEGREMWAVRLNSETKDPNHVSPRPGIVFMGGHHAREHLSVEIPLLMIQYLAENYGKNAQVTYLLDNRDIFFIPNVNVDGSEWDISTGDYKMWRKNRRTNDNRSCPGVDLNRNYGFGWGTGGSSNSPCSDVYMGQSAFSEPETQAIKAFVEKRTNLKVLLSFHTYSELILYPWGGKYDPISDAKDLAAYQKMAQTMAGWNGYTPQQSSELYIASGDTTDWSYGTLGIFSFTFELSPANAWGGGGFYPGSDAIQSTFQANLKPILYLIDIADDPHRSVTAPASTLFYGM